MSVLISDLRYYGSANMPESDGATVGGAIDFSKRVEFAAVTGVSSTYAALSSVAGDTAVKLSYLARDPTGVAVSATLTLNGTTKVNTGTTLQRLLAACQTGGSIAGLANPGGTTASGDVAFMSNTITASGSFQAGSANATTSNPPIAQLAAGQGALAAAGMVLHVLTSAASGQLRRILQVNPNSLGADIVAIDYNWATIPGTGATYEFAPGMFFEQDASSQGVALTGTATHCLAITRLFDTAQADVAGGANRTYYEKVFVNNNNTTTALTSAQVEILSNAPALPAGASLNMAMASGLADALTIANRQTAPTAGSLTTQSSGFPAQPAFLAVQSPGNLPASIGPGNAAGAVALWAQLNLVSGTAAYEGSPGADFRTTGNTT